jgi:hypothetical protein
MRRRFVFLVMLSLGKMQINTLEYYNLHLIIERILPIKIKDQVAYDLLLDYTFLMQPLNIYNHHL